MGGNRITLIAICDNCTRIRKAHYQDVLHGFGRRVWNPAKPKSPGDRYYRCTVCGDLKSFAGSQVPRTQETSTKKKGKQKGT